MTEVAMLAGLLDFTRKRTLDLLDQVEKTGDPGSALAYRPGPGRAHIGWQFMHIAATDDRLVHMVLKGGAVQDPALVENFGGGSTPSDDNVPDLSTIRATLDTMRSQTLAFLETLGDADMERKIEAPNRPTRSVREWFHVIIWHEAHHHGQAHISLNQFKASRA